MSVQDIDNRLGTGAVRDIDLIVRTSEKRLSGFFPWQSVDTEVFFSGEYWPAFSRADLLKALAHYASARSQQLRRQTLEQANWQP